MSSSLSKMLLTFGLTLQASSVFADRVSSLISEQRWYEAKDELTRQQSQQVLDDQGQEKLSQIEKFILNEQYFDVARRLFSQKSYYATLQSLKNIDSDYGKWTEVEKLRSEANDELAYQKATDLFYIGDASQSLEILSKVNGPKVKQLMEQIQRIVELLDEGEESMKSLDYPTALKNFKQVQIILKIPQHAYVVRAKQLEHSIGTPDQIGIKMIAEGNRRWNIGEWKEAKSAYRKALSYSPSLAYKKLNELEEIIKKEIPLAEKLEQTDLNTALTLYQKNLQIVDPESELYIRITKKINQLSHSRGAP